MKTNRSKIQIAILLVSGIILMGLMVLFLLKDEFGIADNDLGLDLAFCLIGVTGGAYFSLVTRRIRPIKYIYFSYSTADEEIANKIAASLEEELMSRSKYRFEILTADSISYGEIMRKKMAENVSKSDIMIVIVSQSYIRSQWCNEEFSKFSRMNKLIIPIVTDSFKDLEKLPKDLSNVKALSLISCDSEHDFSRQISSLAKDLIKRRTD